MLRRLGGPRPAVRTGAAVDVRTGRQYDECIGYSVELNRRRTLLLRRSAEAVSSTAGMPEARLPHASIARQAIAFSERQPMNLG